MTVKMMTVFWYITHLEKCNAFVFYPESVNHKNLRNINQFTLNYMV